MVKSYDQYSLSVLSPTIPLNFSLCHMVEYGRYLSPLFLMNVAHINDAALRSHSFSMPFPMSPSSDIVPSVLAHVTDPFTILFDNQFNKSIHRVPPDLRSRK